MIKSELTPPLCRPLGFPIDARWRIRSAPRLIVRATGQQRRPRIPVGLQALCQEEGQLRGGRPAGWAAPSRAWKDRSPGENKETQRGSGESAQLGLETQPTRPNQREAFDLSSGAAAHRTESPCVDGRISPRRVIGMSSFTILNCWEKNLFCTPSHFSPTTHDLQATSTN